MLAWCELEAADSHNQPAAALPLPPKSLQASGSKVQRVMLTRAVGPTLYARIVLRLPGGQQRSLDARPSDSLALALQTAAPLYISKSLARWGGPSAGWQVLGSGAEGLWWVGALTSGVFGSSSLAWVLGGHACCGRKGEPE